MENRVLLLLASNGVPLDIALAGFPFEEEMIHRESPCIELPQIEETFSALCAIVESTESIDRLNEMRRRAEGESGRQGNG